MIHSAIQSSHPGGWVKSERNPVLGGDTGTCFDVSVLHENGIYRMWFSWRLKRSIALVESGDGIEWGEPVTVLQPTDTGWEDNINRPCVVKRGDGCHMWYTGQAAGRSWIGYAKSDDGLTWIRLSDRPVLSAEAAWEKVALMCPDVMWDEDLRLFRMWYSGGDLYEPDSIGYATSPDGMVWTKHPANPVFTSDSTIAWERAKVTACQVVRQGDWYVMFYIGFRDVHHAQIGIARSRDGLTDWQRHPDNPIISPDHDSWDTDSCYKPYAICDPEHDLWRLWYNGRRGSVEQIGLAIHQGRNLGF
jgi:beta-1,2-mannobiose phosphorylase / 1,2-beta-oligomannan phosphorylase